MTDRTPAVEAFHRSGVKAVLSITGGGSGLIGELLRVPGGSASVLEAVVPYSERSLAAWLGATPEGACCEETALAMAARSFERALTLGGAESALGFGMTASLASSRPKRGEHRVHVATQTMSGTAVRSVVFEKGRRTRAEEEDGCVDVGLSLLLEVFGIDHPATFTLSDTVRSDSSIADPLIAGLRGGDQAAVWWDSRRSDFTANGFDGVGLLSGSFNPPHVGHRELRRVAADWLGGEVHYELPVRNADKPPLDDIRLASRLADLDHHVAVTAADTFARKAAVLPGRVFVVGVDTAVRVLDPRYYPDGLDAALAAVRDAGCRFLVAARVSDSGLLTLGDLAVPAMWRPLFEELPADRFREDVSSTQLRAARRTGESRSE